MAPNDSVRVVKGGVSRNILYPDFLSDVAEDVAANAAEGLSSTTIFSSAVVGVGGASIYFCNTANGDIFITLPVASTTRIDGISTIFQFKRVTTDGNSVTLQPQGGNLIDGDAEVTLAGTNYPNVSIASDGLQWFITGA